MPLRLPPRLPGLRAAALAAAAVAALLLPVIPLAAEPARCSGAVDRHLAELPLAAGDVQSIRIIENVNIADDFGPAILGVDAWVRLKTCSGWLVITMTAKCYVRQSYTRGDCRVEGLPSY